MTILGADWLCSDHDMTNPGQEWLCAIGASILTADKVLHPEAA
jgi:hypothetical protein